MNFIIAISTKGQGDRWSQADYTETYCPSCDGTDLSHYGYILECHECALEFCEFCRVSVEEDEYGNLVCDRCGATE